MNLSLQVVALLWCLLLTWTVTTCDCAPLQTNITGGRNDSTSCVGETVTYACTVDATSHAWSIPSVEGFTSTISVGIPTFPVSPATSQFTIITTSGEGDPLTTALSVTSFAGLDGANITCFNPNVVNPYVVDGDVEDAIAAVFDPPSAPGLTAVPGGDLVSFDFTITRSKPPYCVVNYTISIDDSRDITVPAGEVDGSTPVNVGGFNDVCTEYYNFTIVPVTSDGVVGPSSSTSSGISEGITDVMANTTHLMWSAPTGVPETCFPLYIVSLTSDPTVNLTVNGTVVSSEDLGSFPYCVRQEITVTPIVAVTNTPLTTSSATMSVVINDPEIGVVVPIIAVNLTGSLSATLSWEADEESRNRIVGIGQRGNISGCMNVRTFTEETSTSVEFECDGSGQVVPPCVQYFAGGCSSMPFFVNVSMENVVCPTPQTTTLQTNTGSNVSIGPVVGGVVGGIVAVILVIVVIIIVIIVIKKKGDSGDSTDSAKPKITYHSAGATAGSPQTAVALEEHAPGALYADPKAIEHETAASTGDEYALLNSKTKAKKKNGQAPPEPAPADLGDMYSVPDKTKKQKIQNEGLVYADIDVPQRLPPRSHGSQKQQPQPDEEPVTYATVTSPM